MGAPCEDGKGTNAGAAYIFEKDNNGIWKEAVILRASNGKSMDLFGGSVSIEGDYAVVGASGKEFKGGDIGAAYIFHRDRDGIWNEEAFLYATNSNRSVYFGFPVVIDGDQVQPIFFKKMIWKIGIKLRYSMVRI